MGGCWSGTTIVVFFDFFLEVSQCISEARFPVQKVIAYVRRTYLREEKTLEQKRNLASSLRLFSEHACFSFYNEDSFEEVKVSGSARLSTSPRTEFVDHHQLIAELSLLPFRAGNSSLRDHFLMCSRH